MKREPTVTEGDAGGKRVEGGASGSAYAAAVEGVAVFGHGDRGRFRVRGRAPEQMLNGILSGRMPGPPEPAGEGVIGGEATYHAVLTPKGKMVTDLWCYRLGDEAEHGFLLDVPGAGREGLLAHLGRYLPPRFAALEDVSESTGALTVVGPRAGRVLSRAALGLRLNPSELATLDEGEWRLAGDRADDGLIVRRSAEVWPEAFTVLGPAGAVSALRRMLEGEGVVRGDEATWDTFRVEAGRPAFGVDMDTDTIPVEAGIHTRAIDHTKGCYTGQEVIVRIRDRGHVNRELKLVRLGDVPVPEPGAELFPADRGGGGQGSPVGDGGGTGASAGPVGRVTSAVASPRFGETVALAYIRRGAEGPFTTQR